MVEDSEFGHSVTQFISGLREGDPIATQRIWERFLDRLIRHADRKLKATRRRAEDEEDVVQMAFAQFFSMVEEGKFPRLNDRDDLWQVLTMLVERRAIDLVRRNNTLRRGSGNLHGESIFVTVEGEPGPGIAGTPELIPTPEMAVELLEVFRGRIDDLGDENYRRVALLKMEGYSNSEIAEKLACSMRTVERRLEQIRRKWKESGL